MLHAPPRTLSVQLRHVVSAVAVKAACLPAEAMHSSVVLGDPVGCSPCIPCLTSTMIKCRGPCGHSPCHSGASAFFVTSLTSPLAPPQSALPPKKLCRRTRPTLAPLTPSRRRCCSQSSHHSARQSPAHAGRGGGISRDLASAETRHALLATFCALLGSTPSRQPMGSINLGYPGVCWGMLAGQLKPADWSQTLVHQHRALAIGPCPCPAHQGPPPRTGLGAQFVRPGQAPS
jgi:hypothetical protein